MRGFLVCLAVLGCRKEQDAHPAPQAPAGSAVAGSAVAGSTASKADAGVARVPPEVDLLHALKVRAAVSSVVANPKMSPYDLFDGEMSTAWNSRTGDLAGAWVAFRIPPSSYVEQIKLTVGFTAKGREGDYFTMNQRIQKVAIWHDGVRLREVALDINSRELQTVPVDANGGDYKLEVLAAAPGTKKSWREICISELQVIGQAPPGVKVGKYHWTPELAIGSLDGAVIESDIFELSELPGDDSIDEFCKAFIAQPSPPCAQGDHDCEANPPRNECGGAPAKAAPVPPLPAGWKGQWLRTRHAGASFDVCNFVIEAKGRVYVLEDRGVDDCAQGIALSSGSDLSRQEIRVAEMMGDGGEPELALLTTKPGDGYGLMAMDPEMMRTVGADETFTVCSAGASGIPHCNDLTAAVIVKHIDTGDGPGADGYAEWYEYETKRDISVQNGVLVVKNVKGSMDDYDVRTRAGRHGIRVIEW